jgi:hypothetical protein
MDDQIKPRKKVKADATPVCEKTHGSKSVSFPLVATGNPEAPFGYDDDGRALKAMRSDIEIAAATQAQFANQPVVKKVEKAERKVTVEDIERLINRLRTGKMKDAPQATLNAWGRGEGLTRKPDIVAPVTRTTQARLAEILNYSREQLAEFLEAVVRYNVSEYPDLTQSKVKVTKSTNEVEGLVAGAERRLIEIEKEIESAKGFIKYETDLIAGRSAVRQKILVKQGDLHEVLTRSVREELKRQALRDIAQKKSEIKALEAERKSIMERLAGWRARLADWGKHPLDTTTEYVRTERRIEEYFSDLFRAPRYHGGFLGLVPVGYSYDENPCGAYRQLVFEHGADEKAFKWWGQFENQIVMQGIGLGVVPIPSKEMLRDHPDLARYLSDETSRSLDNDEEEIEVNRDAENRHTLKVGGADIGGQIHGAGWTRDGWRRRGLSNFNTPLAKHRKHDPSEQPEGEPFVGDFEENDSYDPD